MKKIILCSLLTFSFSAQVFAQDVLPADNGLATYHVAPRYRESESHPLRVVGYVLHPIGWVLREGIFRPLSYFAGSTEETRSIMGFREPYDYRQPECFSADDSVPDCRTISPYNYGRSEKGAVVDSGDQTAALDHTASQTVYIPDVNFDFNKHTLNDLGRGRVHQIASLLQNDHDVKIVLQGHADYVGSDSYNEKLGLERAEAVRQELVALGVSGDKISTVTFGETKPVLPEEQNWARAVNRRVEVQAE